MATVTFSVGAKTKTYTITAASATRVANWANAAYATNADGSVNADPLGSALDALWTGIMNNVRAWEKATAEAVVTDNGPIT